MPQSRHHKEAVKLWRSKALPGVTMMHARYVTQSFGRHTHDGFGVGVIEHGALGFYYRGQNVVAPQGAVNMVHPAEVHTGHAAADDGWTYRMLYFDETVVANIASQIADATTALPFFSKGVVTDTALATSLRILHAGTEPTTPADTLAIESRFLEVMSRLIIRHTDDSAAPSICGREPLAIRRTRDYIDSHFADDISLETLASIARLSPYHFIRVFQNATGLPPHTYQLQRRVRRACELLRLGCPVVNVALEMGFSDQSHFTRYFKRIMGVPPGQYRNFVQDA